MVQDSDSKIFFSPVDDDLFADSNVEEFPAGEGDAPTNTPPFDLGELGNAKRIDQEQFPSGNKFLEDILNGQFEFPADDGEGGAYFLSAERTELIGELADAGIKHNPEDIVEIDKTPGGKIIFLETGNSRAGLEHIEIEHGDQFASKGISEAQLPGVLIKAVTEGKIVGYQGTRPIYETTVDGAKQRIAIDVGSNGYIVGANPKSLPK